jgi:hypothetical protein
MHLFVDYIATKRLIAPSLGTAVGETSALRANSTELITRAVATLVTRAAESGAVRKDIAPTDLLRAMVGVSYGNSDEAWEASARRLIDLLMDGLRAAPVRTATVRLTESGSTTKRQPISPPSSRTRPV